MTTDVLKPPKYCMDAIATDIGWIDPKDGSIIMTVKNLRNRIAERDSKKDQPDKVEKVVQLESIPVKRRPGRPKKATT